MTRERRVRMYANHFGLMVQGGDGAFKLVERYDEEREIGTDSTLIRLSVELSNMANGAAQTGREMRRPSKETANRTLIYQELP
jgi:hypothetical protein